MSCRRQKHSEDFLKHVAGLQDSALGAAAFYTVDRVDAMKRS